MRDRLFLYKNIFVKFPSRGELHLIHCKNNYLMIIVFCRVKGIKKVAVGVATLWFGPEGHFITINTKIASAY